MDLSRRMLPTYGIKRRKKIIESVLNMTSHTRSQILDAKTKEIHALMDSHKGQPRMVVDCQTVLNTLNAFKHHPAFHTDDSAPEVEKDVLVHMFGVERDKETKRVPLTSALRISKQEQEPYSVSIFLDNLAFLRHTTSLSIAAYVDSVECVIWLLMHMHVDVNEKDAAKSTASMVAAGMGHLDCLNAMIERGATFDDVDKDGFTAMARAAQHNHVDCIKLMQVWGAQPTQKAFDVADFFNHDECICVMNSEQ